MENNSNNNAPIINNTPPAPQPAPTPQVTEKTLQPPKKSSKKPLLIVLVTVLWLSSMAGAYLANDLFNSDTKEDALTTSDNSNDQSGQSTTESEDTNASSKNETLTKFDYPSNWVLTTDNTLLTSEQVEDRYNFTLLAPGTTETETMIGGKTIVKGSKITFRVEKTSDTKPAAPFKLIDDTVTNLKVANLDSFQYVSLGLEQEIDTRFIKDGRMYSVSFSSDQEKETDSKDYAAYEQILKSIAF